MKNLFTAIALLLVVSMQAQEKRNIGTYTKLDVAGSFDVTLNANATQISIVAKYEEVISHVMTTVTNGTLKIYMEEGYRPRKWGAINIEVPLKALDEVALTGSGDIKSLQTLKSENLIINLTGSGDIGLEVEATNVKAKLIGSGDLKLKGKTDNFKGEVAGSGDLSASGLKSANTKIKVNGSGDASVYASQAIFARVEGSGDIRYAGNPKSEDTKASGSGDITKM